MLIFVDFGRLFTKYKGSAAGGEEQTQEEFNRRRLARTVRSQQPKDLSFSYLKIKGLQRPNFLSTPKIAINLGEALGFDNSFGAFVNVLSRGGFYLGRHRMSLGVLAR